MLKKCLNLENFIEDIPVFTNNLITPNDVNFLFFSNKAIRA